MIKFMNNPFQQSPKTWQLSLTINHRNFESIINFIDNFADTYSIFEIDEENFELRSYFTEYPEEDMLKKLINMIDNEESQEDRAKLKIEEVAHKDWVEEVQKNFKPLNVGNFYITNSFSDQVPLDENKIMITIDPGLAFGTGEHETTSLCLEAISSLKDNYSNKLVMDLGCGSSILAIAMAKYLTPKKVIAVDIDPVAIEVSKKNADINQEKNIDFYCTDNIFCGEYEVEAFDLIVANILMQPLIDMADKISPALKDGGILILSGFLSNQSSQVIEEYQKYDLKFVKRYSKNNWESIIIKK